MSTARRQAFCWCCLLARRQACCACFASVLGPDMHPLPLTHGPPLCLQPGDMLYLGRYLACGAPETSSLYLRVDAVSHLVGTIGTDLFPYYIAILVPILHNHICSHTTYLYLFPSALYTGTVSQQVLSDRLVLHANCMVGGYACKLHYRRLCMPCI